MKLKLVGASEKMLIALKGTTVKRDEVFEVSDDVGLSLLSQNTPTQTIWKQVKETKNMEGKK